MKLYKRQLMRNSVVAFIDILGFSDQIRIASTNAVGNDLLKKLYRAMKEGTSAFQFRYIHPLNCPICDWKAFTDNIVVGFPIPQGKSVVDVLVNSIIKISAYQCALVNEGFFCRGGIAIGDHYMDNSIVFGPALIEAHDLEQKAIYPKIILSKVAQQNIAHKTTLTLFDNSDQTCFVDYLTMLDGYSSPLNKFQNHRDCIVQNLAKFQHGTKILPKYTWLKNYHNSYCLSKYPSLIIP